ncbi:pyridoxal-phosphate dependent enzyme [Actinophytocola sp.]|uniref:pyridoxal-phosphate dependent enzyme n=1 Tax=Actinophytocola sp. TaxID=1872138 RepID=UPI002ED9A146
MVAATSGAVAVAGARLASLLGLSFAAVVPAKTGGAVLARIEREGGRWQAAVQPPAAGGAVAGGGAAGGGRAGAAVGGGHFLDHFAEAERAVAAAGVPTVADEIFGQLSHEPEWIVVGAGTGAMSAAIGRHLRRHGRRTRLAVVDPENSAYFPARASVAGDYGTGKPSRIPGIGRPRVEPGFQPGVVDLAMPVPDVASVAALWWLRDEAGVWRGSRQDRRRAPTCGVCHLVARMREEGAKGSIVTIIGDGAEPYRNTHHDAEWARARGLDPTRHAAVIERFVRTGEWRPA